MGDSVDVIWDVEWYGHIYRIERTKGSAYEDNSPLYVYYVDDEKIDVERVGKQGNDYFAVESLRRVFCVPKKLNPYTRESPGWTIIEWRMEKVT